MIWLWNCSLYYAVITYQSGLLFDWIGVPLLYMYFAITMYPRWLFCCVFVHVGIHVRAHSVDLGLLRWHILCSCWNNRMCILRAFWNNQKKRQTHQTCCSSWHVFLLLLVQVWRFSKLEAFSDPCITLTTYQGSLTKGYIWVAREWSWTTLLKHYNASLLLCHWL